MSGRRRQTLSPSLFPFLAVLVCTLGTLILLLALVAENSTDAIVAAAEAEQVEDLSGDSDQPKLTMAQVQDLIEEERFRTEEFVDMRDAQTADLENRRDQLAHLDDHIRRIRLKLKHINDQLIAAESDSPSDPVDDEKLVVLQEQLEKNKAELEKLREKSKDKTPRVVIVPHKGPNGTDRRPIYIECTAEGVTIWPEGSKIEMGSLEDTTRSANPLDAALRVARYRALQDYGDQVAPYPMLIVRPDGVASYSAARTAMQDWDDQFGYELVPAQVELAYATPDIELKNRMEDAIRQAVIKQYSFQAIADRGPGGGGSGRSLANATRSQVPSSASGVGGGTVSNSPDKPLPRLSAAQMDRQGRSSGFDDHRAPVGSSYSGSYGASNPYSAGTGDDVAAKLDARLREAASQLNTDGGLPGDPLSGLGYPQGSDIAAGTATDELGRQLTQNPPSGVPPPTATASEQRVGGKYQQNPYAPSEAMDSQTAAGNSAPGDRMASSDAAMSLTAPMTDTPPATSTGSSAMTSSINSGSTPPQNQSSPSNPNQVAGSSTRGSQMSPDLPADMQNVDPSAQPPSGLSANVTKSSTPPSASTVRRGGMDWALPPEVAQSRGNAIVRSIRVECYQDSFVLLPSSRPGERAQSFSFTDGEVNRATLELATAIRDRISSWGAAIPGGRWQPRLDVTVMERGDHRFHQLRTLMTGSGIEVERSNGP
ncbi:hypothetical protein [Stieleria varia]|uniref:IncA protein n=1 Tax=Stieleria varia TaxID=2528005 RepID=A0A5C6AKB8_9BACT|nr:hypothetical protein [Stieleria varia]TWT98603.1 hypothetical protein Pla52n_51200 [Stieleria varia]